MKITGNHSSAIILTALVIALLPESSVAEEIKPLEKYPKVDRIWLGMQEGSVRPAAYIQYRARAEGYLQLEAEEGQSLEKHQRWAVMDPEQVELEIRSLELEKKRLDQDLRKLRKGAWQSEAQLTIELREMLERRDALLEASGSNDVPRKLRAQAADAAERMEDQIEVQLEMLEPAQLKQAAEIEIEAAELALARKKQQMEILKKRSFFTAPFAGELHYSDQVLRQIEDGETKASRVWLANNDIIGSVVDDSKHEIVVVASGPVMSSVPSKQLLVLLQQPKTGKMIHGRYVRTEDEDSGLEIRQKYIFSVDETGIEDARQSVGQRNLVHLYRRFERRYHLVPKRDIAFAAPDILAKGGWAGLSQHLWPECQVVQVGPQSLLIDMKHED